MRPTPVLPIVLLSLAACGRPAISVEYDGTVVDAEQPTAPFPGLVSVPNIDDDDGDGTLDWDQRGADDDDDLAALVVPATAFDALRGRDRLELALSGDGDVRVWHDGEVVLDGDAGSVDVRAGDSDVSYAVEVGQPMASGALELRHVDGKGEIVSRLTVPVTGAPLLLNHHLQPAERVFVMRVSDGGWTNAPMVADMQGVLGEALTIVAPNRYGWDVWVQDEPEFATLSAPGQRLDVVIDSVRNRGLDPFPEDIAEPGLAAHTWGSRNWGMSQDSFGNLETTPPIDGYPFGRIYYGEAGNRTVDPVLVDLLEAQRVQDPFTIDIGWLCVGHVDEFTSFVPDDAAPRGFRFLVADIGAGYDLLEAQSPDMPIPRYAGSQSHGLSTIGDMLDEPGLRPYNEDLQADHIEPVIDRFREEIGLTDDEIIRIPALFERVGGCGAAALIPGTVNLTIAEIDGDTHVFLADPFLRSTGDQADDVLISEVTALLPPDLRLHWVDDFDVYHLGLGEVHCGTNVVRPPAGEWWTEAIDLLEAP